MSSPPLHLNKRFKGEETATTFAYFTEWAITLFLSKLCLLEGFSLRGIGLGPKTHFLSQHTQCFPNFKCFKYMQIKLGFTWCLIMQGDITTICVGRSSSVNQQGFPIHVTWCPGALQLRLFMPNKSNGSSRINFFMLF